MGSKELRGEVFVSNIHPVLGGDGVWAANSGSEVWVAPGVTLCHVDPTRMLVHKEHNGVEWGAYQGNRGRIIVKFPSKRRHILVVLVSTHHRYHSKNLKSLYQPFKLCLLPVSSKKRMTVLVEIQRGHSMTGQLVSSNSTLHSNLYNVHTLLQ